MALYILIFIGTLGLSLFTAWRVKAVYRRYAAQPALSVEFDASRRAKVLLSNTGIVAGSEVSDVDRVLNAAAWTYVAAFITSLAYLLYYLLPLLAGSRQ